jgi:hypothetical protein
VAFINFTPFVFAGQTYTDNNKEVIQRALQVNLSAGSDVSTKFYRVFNLKTNFLGLDLNGLRHIITPTASYSYNKNATMPIDQLRFKGDNSLTSSAVALELSNKLQTKRNEVSVDIADFRISSNYTIASETADKHGGNFSDFLFKLELLPYSWLRIYGDATYKHSGNRSNEGYNCFTQANYDIDFNFGPERSFGIGQRYNRKGSNAIIYDFQWRLNPKWKFNFYHRINRGNELVDIRQGLVEQEYTVTRDLHCWVTALTCNLTRGKGTSVWLVFRLKAFPELEFELNQSYHAPKPGSQTNQ